MIMASASTSSQSVEAIGQLSALEQEVLTRFRRMTTEIEPLYLTQAARQLEAHLNSKPDSRISSWARYVLGDIARRAGQNEDAASHFRTVVSSPYTDPQLKKLAQWFLDRA